MKFASVLGFFFLTSGLVIAEKLDQCQELYSRVSQNTLHKIFCENNEEGKIQTIKINDFDIMTAKENLETIQSYDSVSNFSYYLMDSHYGPGNHDRLRDITNLTNLKNFKNLEKLKIIYGLTYYSCTAGTCYIYDLGNIETGTFKDLKNLKELAINGIELSQDNINEISKLMVKLYMIV